MDRGSGIGNSKQEISNRQQPTISVSNAFDARRKIFKFGDSPDNSQGFTKTFDSPARQTAFL